MWSCGSMVEWAKATFLFMALDSNPSIASCFSWRLEIMQLLFQALAQFCFLGTIQRPGAGRMWVEPNRERLGTTPIGVEEAVGWIFSTYRSSLRDVEDP